MADGVERYTQYLEEPRGEGDFDDAFGVMGEEEFLSSMGKDGDLDRFYMDSRLDDLDTELRERDDETSNKAKRIAEELYSDADLIMDPDFLNEMGGLPIYYRIQLLSRVANQCYTSPENFREYFSYFPDDAVKIVFIVIDNGCGEIGDWEVYQLGSKVFEAALCAYLQRDPKECWRLATERWGERDIYYLGDYQQISERSKLARRHLAGDYKTAFAQRFSAEKYGSDLAGRTAEIFEAVSKSLLPGRYPIDTEYLFPPSEYAALSPDKRVGYLWDIIVECQKEKVFEEVFNSRFDEQARESRGSAKFARGRHSILYDTRHTSSVYSNESYHDFDPIPIADYDPGGEWELLMRKAIRLMGEEHIGGGESEQVVDQLLEFWDKNTDPFYGPEIASTLSEQNVTYATSRVLERLADTDEHGGRRLLSLLYRLELGRVGITNGRTLEYLERRFELQLEENERADVAYRITADGKVGIFQKQAEADGQEKLVLIGFIQLVPEDFTSDQTAAIQRTVEHMRSNRLFYTRGSETAEDQARREELTQLYCQNVDGELFQPLETHTGVHANNLHLQEQGWVILYLREIENIPDPAEQDAVRQAFFDFVNKHG